MTATTGTEMVVLVNVVRSYDPDDETYLFEAWPIAQDTLERNNPGTLLAVFVGQYVAVCPLEGWDPAPPKPGSPLSRWRFRSGAGRSPLETLYGRPCPPHIWTPGRRWPVRFLPRATIAAAAQVVRP